MNFYWKASLADLNAISGKAEDDRGIVVTDDGDVSLYVYDGSNWVRSRGSIGPTEVVKAATASLTAAECSNTIINNYGQSAASTLTLPVAAAGLGGILVVGTSGYALHLKAGSGDKLYLDGFALDDGDKASNSSPAVGDYITFWSFKTGASAWDWIAKSGDGTWTDGGA